MNNNIIKFDLVDAFYADSMNSNYNFKNIETGLYKAHLIQSCYTDNVLDVGLVYWDNKGCRKAIISKYYFTFKSRMYSLSILLPLLKSLYNQYIEKYGLKSVKHLSKIDFNMDGNDISDLLNVFASANVFMRVEYNGPYKNIRIESI